MKNYNLEIILEIGRILKEKQKISDSEVLNILNEYFKNKSDEVITLEFSLRKLTEIVKIINKK